MKISAPIITICLTLFVCCGGCSREEPPPSPEKKIKVVKPIERSAPEKAKPSLTGVEEEAKPSLTGVEEGAKTEAEGVEEVKTAAVEEKELKIPERGDREKEPAIEEVTGYHIVKKGESLSVIAAREDVCGDSLKWPILYRINMDKLANGQLGEDFPNRELPEGVRLKIISPDEIRGNLKNRLHNVWVINVLSVTTNGKIIPVAIKLIKNGYPAYITRTKVKGKDWMRLRVGFFKNKTKAETEGKNIMTMLNLTDPWITKVGRKEFEEFGGY